MNEEEKEAIKDLIDSSYESLLDGTTITSNKAINTILNLIEKLQKENEKLKEERQIVGIPVKNKRDGRIGIVLHQWESGSVAVLESINPRVINTHDSWNTLEIVTDEVKQTQTKCETIPVQKVKDKIRKNEEIIDISNDGDLIHELLQKNKVYEELLESEE